MTDDKYRDKWESSVDRSLEMLSERQMSMRGEVGQIHAELRAVRMDTSNTNRLLESVHKRLDKIVECELPVHVRNEVVKDWDEVRLYSFRFGGLLKTALFKGTGLLVLVILGLIAWAISKGFTPL